MKLTMLIGLLCGVAFADQPSMQSKTAIIDTNATNIATTYGTTGVFLTGLGGQKQHVYFINGTAQAIAGALNSTLSNCSDGVDNFEVPANGSIALDFIQIGSQVCLRSLGTTISSSSTISYLGVW